MHSITVRVMNVIHHAQQCQGMTCPYCHGESAMKCVCVCVCKHVYVIVKF